MTMSYPRLRSAMGQCSPLQSLASFRRILSTTRYRPSSPPHMSAHSALFTSPCTFPPTFLVRAPERTRWRQCQIHFPFTFGHPQPRVKSPGRLSTPPRQSNPQQRQLPRVAACPHPCGCLRSQDPPRSTPHRVESTQMGQENRYRLNRSGAELCLRQQRRIPLLSTQGKSGKLFLLRCANPWNLPSPPRLPPLASTQLVEPSWNRNKPRSAGARRATPSLASAPLAAWTVACRAALTATAPATIAGADSLECILCHANVVKRGSGARPSVLSWRSSVSHRSMD